MGLGSVDRLFRGIERREEGRKGNGNGNENGMSWLVLKSRDARQVRRENRSVSVKDEVKRVRQNRV